MSQSPHAGEIPITPELVIPESEIAFSASRAGGPGGQHVNKTSTRVTLSFDVEGSKILTREQKDMILARLGPRLTSDGVLKISSGETRSQFSNRELARRRLAELVRAALTPPKKRTRTRPSRAALEGRIQSKKHRAKKKKLRHKPGPEDA